MVGTVWKSKMEVRIACEHEMEIEIVGGEFETLPVTTKPKTSHHRSPGGERCGKRMCLTIFLERTRECIIRWTLELFQMQLWENF